MLFWATIAIASTGVLLALLDFILSDTQKRWLDDRHLRLWHTLAQAKERPFLDWLRRRYGWIIGAAVLLEIIYVGLLIWNIEIEERRSAEDFATVTAIALVIAGLSAWIGLSIIKFTLRARSLPVAFLRAAIFAALTLTPLLVMSVLAPSFTASVLPSLLTSEPTIGIALAQLLTVFVVVISIHCTAIVLIFWAAVALPLACIYGLAIVIFVSELLVRRAAEHPKALLTGSAVLAATAVLLKMLR